jgi:hypothetical protein
MSERFQRDPVAWEPLAAGACFAVAVIALAFGFAFTTRWVLDDHLHPVLHTLGLILLMAGIPIMMLGAHFMDLQEKKLSAKSHRESTPSQIVVVLLTVLFIHSTAVHAQQTIFNVPTTDVLDKGKVYAELDASLKPTDGSDVPKFSSFVPRIVIGAGGNVEFGLNITGNIQPGPDSTTLVPAMRAIPSAIKTSQEVITSFCSSLVTTSTDGDCNAGRDFHSSDYRVFRDCACVCARVRKAARR